jgi:hypothetical protein
MPRTHVRHRPVGTAVVGSVTVVVAGSVAQLIDYAFFDLRIPALDSSGDGGVFGVVGDLAALSAAAAAWWLLVRERPIRPAVVALPPLVTFIAVDKAVRLHDHLPHYLVLYAPVLGATGLCLIALIRAVPTSRARLLSTGLALLASSFTLHLVGEQLLLRMGLAHVGWAQQLKAVVKHGLEVQAWLLVLIGLASGAPRRRPRSPRP